MGEPFLMTRPRYRMEGLPGIAPAREWNPPAPPRDRPQQGWLPFSDGGQLGPLFDTTTAAQDR
jgi:hypothetical protein